MRKFIGILSLFLVFGSYKLIGQNKVGGIVKVIAKDRNTERSGSGIVTGRIGAYVFIATAYHVVKDMDMPTIKIHLNDEFGTVLSANTKKNIKEGLDLIVLIADDFGHKIKIPKYKQLAKNKLKKDLPVKILGFPNERFDENNLNFIKEISTGEIRISSTGLTKGFSGGLVLSRKKNRIIGMIIQDEAGIDGLVIPIDLITENLNRWGGVPTGSISKIAQSWKWGFWVYLGLSAGSAYGGYEFNRMGTDKFDIFKTNRDPSAPVYDELRMTRTELLNKANANYDWRNGFYIGSVVLVGLSICNQYLFDKKEETNGLSLHFKPTIDWQTGQLYAGIIMKF